MVYFSNDLVDPDLLAIRYQQFFLHACEVSSAEEKWRAANVNILWSNGEPEPLVKVRPLRT